MTQLDNWNIFSVILQAMMLRWRSELVEAIGKKSVAQEVEQLQRGAVVARRSKLCVRKKSELFRMRLHYVANALITFTKNMPVYVPLI